MPLGSATPFISFTRPMFTAQWMFSGSLAISATRVELTGTTRSMAAPWSATPTSRHHGVLPPQNLGISRVSKSRLPESSRSGENTRKKAVTSVKTRRSIRGRS